MTKHQWVELKMTPVEVEADEQGNLQVHATEGAIEIADEDAKYGCWHCFVELTTESFSEECPYVPAVPAF